MLWTKAGNKKYTFYILTLTKWNELILWHDKLWVYISHYKCYCHVESLTIKYRIISQEIIYRISKNYIIF